MKRISSKQAIIIRNLQKAKKEIAEEREPVCSGCGRWGLILSPSHLISVDDCKRYGLVELIWDKDNIQLHCMGYTGCCHLKWESRDLKQIKTMLDAEKNLAYVKSKCPVLFNKIRVR